jgi:hypothetical protein
VRATASASRSAACRNSPAAHALTAAADSEVIDRLRPLVPSVHWRNTWLFAAGHLSRTREHLRDSVLALLREVDLSDDLMQLAALGANSPATLSATD